MKKLLLLACALATVSVANASWPEYSWQGWAFPNNGTWAEDWVSDNNHQTFQDITNWGQISVCNWGAGTCQVNHTESVQTTWAEATTLGAKFAIPKIWKLSVTQSFIYGKSQTTSDALTQNINQGQKAQFYVHVNRRFGWTTLHGQAYYQSQKDIKGYCIPKRGCVNGYTMWIYEWDNWESPGMLSSYKAQSPPIWGYIITKI